MSQEIKIYVNKYVEVKFVWQISGPPVTVIHFLGNDILGYLIDTNFNFLINLKSKLKGYQVFEKNHQLIIFGPKLLDVMTIWGSANQPTIVIFFISYTKSKLKGSQKWYLQFRRSSKKLLFSKSIVSIEIVIQNG